VIEPEDKRECQFKVPPACRMYTLCMHAGYGNGKNSIRCCFLYWELVTDRIYNKLNSEG